MSSNQGKRTTEDSKYSQMVLPYQEEALKVLTDFVAIPSVYDEKSKSKDKPFGENVDKALAFVADLGKKLGFSVDRCDGYATELCYGEGKNTLDIYAHADVVPVRKEGWKHDPFHLTLEEGNLYGRGAADDKGPGISCLFALKALMDNKRTEGVKIRFFVGGDEERGSSCLDHYLHAMKKGYPTFGFSPDSDYPVIYGEKSIYAYKATYECELDCEDFSCGDALNIVIPKCSVRLKSRIEEAKLLAMRFSQRYPKVRIAIEGDKLTVTGKPAHGSMPWEGLNAGLFMLLFLGYLYDEKRARDIFEHYSSGKGESFRGDFRDKDFDCTSYNVGKIVYDGKKVEVYVNLRFPSTMDEEDVLKNCALNTGAEIENLGGSRGFVFDLESPYLKALVNAYREETGDKESKPLAIGGGTYARESRNAVAFGAQFPGRDYRMHGDDEFFPLADFQDNMVIYAHAIDSLVQLLKEDK